MSHPTSTEQSYLCTPKAVSLAEMANIFEFATSRLLAIRMTLDTSTVVTSSKVRYIVTKYLMWEGDMELLNYQEFYDAFMKLPVAPSTAWVTGCIAGTYLMLWWTEAFHTADYQTFTTNLPNFRDIREMVNSHFEQLPEGHLLVTPATLVHTRSMLVVQQLANIQAGIVQEGEHIVALLESKVVEARLVTASLLRMETALGQDVRTAIAATERLVKYLKREGE
ncbi:uncharacterized protein EDB91DRAFT_1088441 [Suillus paluster]|uniref:uncharacterized protein n=1 Tax=Suillus paluster TaxID=48578 RepID=UPI001B87662A|nr:uncharacterized protein EDB91DRAFT_1088441 [Suillus paluster]KAG1721476.1 hypothetical protein EDB91DRAFT_1088441 [Suillus paluster]